MTFVIYYNFGQYEYDNDDDSISPGEYWLDRVYELKAPTIEELKQRIKDKAERSAIEFARCVSLRRLGLKVFGKTSSLEEAIDYPFIPDYLQSNYDLLSFCSPIMQVVEEYRETHTEECKAIMNAKLREILKDKKVESDAAKIATAQKLARNAALVENPEYQETVAEIERLQQKLRSFK